MVNAEDFIKRLEVLLDFYSLSASGFADKIDVQRSSLSHLLSGRNKPSLDFIMKIVAVFPDVDLYWILNGTGSFPKFENIDDNAIAKKIIAPNPILENNQLNNLFTANSNSSLENTKEDIENKILEINQNLLNKNVPRNLNIERIVFFYNDGTFAEYCPK